MAFVEYNPAKGNLRPGSAKLTKTHLILSDDMQQKLNSTHVKLAYDPDTQFIRLQPSEDSGLKMVDGKIQSKGFTKFFNINKRGVFDAQWKEEEKAVYIKLS